MDSRSLWARTASGDDAARDAILRENLSLVHHVARQLSRSLAVEADFDELVSAGTIGLMTAVKSFDARRGLAFSTFAVPRIRGSILDELRRQDHVPRSVRRKARDISRAREQLMRQLGRMPEDSEMALAARHRRADVLALAVRGGRRRSISRSRRRPATTEATIPVARRVPAATTRRRPTSVCRARARWRMLREAILRLNDQERTVLSLYYFEELKSADIADVLGISESRVSQIRSKALGRLRSELAPMRASA